MIEEIIVEDKIYIMEKKCVNCPDRNKEEVWDNGEFLYSENKCSNKSCQLYIKK